MRDLSTWIEELRQDMIADHDRLIARLQDLLGTISDGQGDIQLLVAEIATRHSAGQASIAQSLGRLAVQIGAQPRPTLPNDERYGHYNGVIGHG